MPMTVRVHYATSTKDARGTLHTYRNEIEMDFDVEGLTQEQKVMKMRQIQHFLHNELHGAIQAAQIADGIPPDFTHVNTKPVPVKAKQG